MVRRSVHFFEPWTARPSRTWEASFHCPPACEDQQVLDRWAGDRARAERNAPWVVWGTDLTTPGVGVSLLGKPVVLDGQGVVLDVHPLPYEGPAEGPRIPDQGAIAGRIAACVTACAGIRDPIATIATIRELLFELLDGRTDATDERILACAARLLKPEHPVAGEDDEPP